MRRPRAWRGRGRSAARAGVRRGSTTTLRAVVDVEHRPLLRACAARSRGRRPRRGRRGRPTCSHDQTGSTEPAYCSAMGASVSVAARPRTSSRCTRSARCSIAIVSRWRGAGAGVVVVEEQVQHRLAAVGGAQRGRPRPGGRRRAAPHHGGRPPRTSPAAASAASRGVVAHAGGPEGGDEVQRLHARASVVVARGSSTVSRQNAAKASSGSGPALVEHVEQERAHALDGERVGDAARASRARGSARRARARVAWTVARPVRGANGTRTRACAASTPGS